MYHLGTFSLGRAGESHKVHSDTPIYMLILTSKAWNHLILITQGGKDHFPHFIGVENEGQRNQSCPRLSESSLTWVLSPGLLAATVHMIWIF